MARKLTIYAQDSGEWLEQALAAGLLSQEAEKRVREVVERDRAMVHENRILRAQLRDRNAALKVFRAQHLEALQFTDSQRAMRLGQILIVCALGCMIGVAIGLIL